MKENYKGFQEHVLAYIASGAPISRTELASIARKYNLPIPKRGKFNQNKHEETQKH